VPTLDCTSIQKGIPADMVGLAGEARRLLLLQSGLLLVSIVGAGSLFGATAAMAAAYGALTAMLNTWMSGRRLAKALEVARTQPGRETAVLYGGAVQRFVMMAAAFMLGMGALKLPPGALLVGFALTYSAIVMIRPGMPTSVPDSTKEN